ncbi:helicase-related protein [Salinispira pacifica]|uniref:helicase-related protein n=1 Tax=Salinispira pacifica TaxID=1307761 RepID=UPI00146F9AE2|nr:helicase-related protein [Salinispira pacifica]
MREEAQGLKERIFSSICRNWGLDYLYPHQKLCIDYLLAGTGYFGEAGMAETRNGILVSLPTGSGKSLCFMAPAARIDGVTLILYPLNALLRDQQARFRRAGVPAELYYGGMTTEERSASLEKIGKMQKGVIISNCESAFSPGMLQALETVSIRLLVVDEGHLILQWGTSFRPSLFHLIQLKRHLENPLTAVFTATISPDDRHILGTLLWSSADWDYVEMLSDRPNIRYRVVPCLHAPTALRLFLRQRFDPSWGFLAEQQNAADELNLPMLVFGKTRKICEDLARKTEIWLNIWGIHNISCGYYHAGLDRDTRKQIENDFAAERRGILFTTKAFGTGVDIPGIRCCVHLSPPENMEDFLQESGRAGRDGNAACSLLFQETGMDFFPAGGCRRRHALSSLGQEIEHCSGCDHCEGNVILEFPEGVAVRAFRDHYRLRLGRDVEKRILSREDFADFPEKLFSSI